MTTNTKNGGMGRYYSEVVVVVRRTALVLRLHEQAKRSIKKSLTVGSHRYKRVLTRLLAELERPYKRDELVEYFLSYVVTYSI